MSQETLRHAKSRWPLRKGLFRRNAIYGTVLDSSLLHRYDPTPRHDASYGDAQPSEGVDDEVAQKRLVCLVMVNLSSRLRHRGKKRDSCKGLLYPTNEVFVTQSQVISIHHPYNRELAFHKIIRCVADGKREGFIAIAKLTTPRHWIMTSSKKTENLVALAVCDVTLETRLCRCHRTQSWQRKRQRRRRWRWTRRRRPGRRR